ncbi:MAG: galactose mutarotase [Gammaproteobacteria bacterium]|nr:galactose mutarotase [Gammaproteobacteria bacterium]
MLQNKHLRTQITDYGGRIVSLEVPHRGGARRHVALGFDRVADYVRAGKPFGALLGRTSNRIAGGRFLLDGRSYDLVQNEGDNTLHGGGVFGNVFWLVSEASATQLVLTHVSPDGDQGFPGELTVRAAYRLDGTTLWLELEAQTSKPTVVSLSAHPYFNLGGLQAGSVLDHELTIAAETYLPTDAAQIPTGERRSVAGTPFDFRKPMPAAARIRDPDPQLLYGKGYDHYFIIDAAKGGTPSFAARARDPATGCTLDVYTTQPGLQFYTGNNLDATIAGRGGIYRQSAGFAFEPQGFPNAPNQKEFPSTILRPGETYRHSIGYAFSLTEPEPGS